MPRSACARAAPLRHFGLAPVLPAAVCGVVVLLLPAPAASLPAVLPRLAAPTAAAAPAANAPARTARSRAAVALGDLAAPSIASAGTSAPFAGLTAPAPFRRRAR